MRQFLGNRILGHTLFAILVTFIGASFVVNGFAAENVTSTPLRIKGTPGGTTRFVEVSPDRSGIDFVHPIDKTHRLKHLYVGGFASAGVAIGDLNGDSVQDIFLTGGPVKNRLYIQKTDDNAPTLSFRDATVEAGIGGGDKWAAGVALVDIDNDGDLDIYICYYDSENELYLNQTEDPSKLEFREAAKEFGLNLVDASFMPAFCDYDLDGDLDVFVAAHQYVNPAGRPKTPPVHEKDGKYTVHKEFQKYYSVIKGLDGRPTFTNVGREDYLLQSNLSQVNDPEKMKFTNVTKRAGISGIGVGNSMLWWDFNSDGLPDIFIGNDFKVADQLFKNNGDGTFTDVIRDTFSHTTWFSMGSDAGDINNDGMIDLLVSDMAGTSHYRSKVTMGEMSVNALFLKTSEPRQLMRNALYVNTGTPRFMEAAYMTGLASSDWTWATKLADLDNDGWLDVYLTNGAARMFNHSDMVFAESAKIGKTQWELWENTEPRLEENLAFKNLGDLQFKNVSDKWGLRKSSMSYSAAYGDLDNDGDLDLVVTHLDEPVSIYENQTAGNQSVRIALRGNRSNRFGIGAEVRIDTENGTQARQLMPMTGFLSCNEPFVHFGLGSEETIKKMTIRWPSGIQQTLHDLPTNQLHTISEPASSSLRHEKAPSHRFFRPSPTFPALRHIDNEYDDFVRQPLLPFKHSQLGPSFAMADVDGDKDLDFYLGRSSGTPRAVYDNQGKAKLGVKPSVAFQSESKYEDLGALFFDADQDGDQDLYVVSGSVECAPNDPVLQDRLYLNDGKGVFVKADADSIPVIRDSGSIVCAADYDRDGDLDLFVGGRIIPGQFPVAPNSYILRNDSQSGKAKFTDVASELSNSLRKTGLVTSALWSDADGDGWIDLFVTHDWGNVKFFRNENKEGKRILVDQTKQAGLAERLGWWNGIAGRDLDNDGDIDYVATNFGLNTTYHPSVQKPELLFYGDFDGTGKPHLVEAKYEKGKCFPRRGLSCSSHAMPFIRDKVQTFHNFGLSTLQDIYTDTKLTKSLQLTANSLESCIIINQSTPESGPKFEFQPLDRITQISPAYGVVLEDFDADGWADCFIAQNFYSPQVETGRMDSGLSMLMRGGPSQSNGAISLSPVWPKESGIVIPGDAKAVSVVDFNEDGWSDLLVTVNNNFMMPYEAIPHAENRAIRVRLVGPNGNPTCVGAVVTLRFQDESLTQTAEVYAGGGYLSQSSNRLSFGAPNGTSPIGLQVRWPNGKSSKYKLRPNLNNLVARQPK